jgi:uracil-DNA glycosylase
MGRTAGQVIEQLLTSMHVLVRSYHPDVRNTGSTLSELIPGTAFFPGGTGLWRGNQPFGRLPDSFPDAPVMFLGHNFDSIRAHDDSMLKGGEGQSLFWRILLAYLSHAHIGPEKCFFTNALMGLKPGSAVGSMPAIPGYHDECQAFLNSQIEIVKPSLIVALGQKAFSRVSKLSPAIRTVDLLHPSARELKPLGTRRELIEGEGNLLSRAIRLSNRTLDE